MSLALEIQHAIDHVLEDPRPRELPLFRDMPDQNDGEVVALGNPGQLGSAFADLRHRAWG